MNNHKDETNKINQILYKKDKKEIIKKIEEKIDAFFEKEEKLIGMQICFVGPPANKNEGHSLVFEAISGIKNIDFLFYSILYAKILINQKETNKISSEIEKKQNFNIKKELEIFYTIADAAKNAYLNAFLESFFDFSLNNPNLH